MNILERYIGLVVAAHIAIVMLVLLTMYFFSEFVIEMGEVGRGSYDTLDAVRYTIKLMPRQAYELFPLVALLGTMLGLGALANNSELTVMRAAGISLRQILLAVMKTGVLIVLLVGIIGEGVAPQLEKQARLQRAQALQENFSLTTEEGMWGRDGDTFIRIKRLLPNGVASDVSFYRFVEKVRLQEISHANKAIYKDGVWHLSGVRKTFVDVGGVTTQQMAEEIWQSTLTPDVLNIVAIPPENLSAFDLYEYVVYLKDNGLDARHYELSLWIRLVAPLATGGMILLAVPFVVGSLRTVGVGQRIMVGALLGISFYLFNAIFNRIGLIYELPPVLSAVLPTSLVFLLWLVMMRRVS